MIDQIDVGAVPQAFVQVFCKCKQVFFFLAPGRMPAVHGDADKAIRFQQGKTAPHSF